MSVVVFLLFFSEGGGGGGGGGRYPIFPLSLRLFVRLSTPSDTLYIQRNIIFWHVYYLKIIVLKLGLVSHSKHNAYN